MVLFSEYMEEEVLMYLCSFAIYFICLHTYIFQYVMIRSLLCFWEAGIFYYLLYLIQPLPTTLL